MDREGGRGRAGARVRVFVGVSERQRVPEMVTVAETALSQAIGVRAEEDPSTSLALSHTWRRTF